MSIRNKQHLVTFEARFIKELGNIETELKKCVTLKKACIIPQKKSQTICFSMK